MKLKKVRVKSLRLAFDGYSASGKSLGAKLISKKFKLHLLNSGLLYRFSAFAILKYKPKNKIFFLKKEFKKLSYKKLTQLNLHTQEISNYSAIIAKQRKIRLILKDFQKKFARKYKNIAIEGRDISTNILKNNPRYDVSFFFKCSINTAAYRRWKDLKRSNSLILQKSIIDYSKNNQKIQFKTPILD